MHVKLLGPGLSLKDATLQVEPQMTVRKFRQLVATMLELPTNGFRMIALGKILEDFCADKSPATLFVTYRIKNNTSVLIHKIRREDAPSTPSEEAANTKANADQLQDVETNDVSTQTPMGPNDDYQCRTCHNNPRTTKCRECGCQKCLKKSGNPLICDECDMYWHIECAGLDAEPTDDYWYCPNCKNQDVDVIVGSGKGVNMRNSKSAKKPAAIQTKAWGGGISCSGRDRECVIVPSTHVGAIPGIYCGQQWEYRLKCSEWGVHRPPVGGISGSTATGAVSVVLSQGYADDKDYGDEFLYTGSGGRNLEGNKRMGKHASDQELTRFNLSLAMTCAAPVDAKNGAEAANWKESRAIRVCRTKKLAVYHPEYAPSDGVRYDGVYKIVKYWPEKGESGYRVWRFLFRRDDPSPAPWTEEGKRSIEQAGLRTIMADPQKTENKKRYRIPSHISKLMDQDADDKRIWDEVKNMVFWSEYEFIHHVFANAIVCPSGTCAIPIVDPVTTPCGHICCKHCLKHNESFTCSTCRSDISELRGKKKLVNDDLVAVLKACNWAYGVNTSSPLPKVSKTTSAKKKVVDDSHDNLLLPPDSPIPTAEKRARSTKSWSLRKRTRS
ncbi:PUA-like domain-containing protein [Radiomyces spectabilis]|uniref:PUA-like domain-containing protein n=1 Tax=Radiomyces spectabilis TaxID=64574 RepID=UPI00221FEA79|nr:PUA-like domain-containing protein [Radiomyces spectabilis]KAI8388306.1 PUA-like domain-containing protein [Radiomyces spectabilis]